MASFHFASVNSLILCAFLLYFTEKLSITEQRFHFSYVETHIVFRACVQKSVSNVLEVSDASGTLGYVYVYSIPNCQCVCTSPMTIKHCERERKKSLTDYYSNHVSRIADSLKNLCGFRCKLCAFNFFPVGNSYSPWKRSRKKYICLKSRILFSDRAEICLLGCRHFLVVYSNAL